MLISALEALARLREGNKRFVSSLRSGVPCSGESRQPELVMEAQPGAIILSCSDARVPPEIIFDQGIGDLFIVRVAGNVAGPTQLGSIQFAAEVFGTRLVVVLGHSQCGAILATLKGLGDDSLSELSPSLRAIVDLVQPAVKPLLKTEVAEDQTALVAQAVRANVEKALRELREDENLAKLIAQDGLVVVGAEYSMETGVVEFYED